MTQAGTTPASGIPRKKRAVSKPAAFVQAAIDITMMPQRIMTVGKKFFAETCSV